MNSREVYNNYGTPENLQQHMLRVAALGSIVLKNWTGVALDDQSIIQTLLFHDIAKPVTFDIAKQARFVTLKSELLKLESTIRSLIENYGSDEHAAALKIFQEIGLSKNAQRLIDNLEWHYTDRHIELGDTESLVTIYCDMRIGPNNLLSIDERLHELHNRAPIDQFEDRLVSAKELQRLITASVDIDLENIQNAQVEEIVKRMAVVDIYGNIVEQLEILD